jgi:hypothetical protein
MWRNFIIIDAAAAIVDITIRPAIKTEVVVALAVGVSDFLVCTFKDISMYYKKEPGKFQFSWLHYEIFLIIFH